MRLTDGNDELYYPVGYGVIDLTDVVDVKDNTWFEQVDDLIGRSSDSSDSSRI